MEKKLKNFTPHPVVIMAADKATVITTIPPVLGADGKPVFVRVVENTVDVEPINGVPCKKKSYGGIVGLPAPEAGVIYIVSAMVLAATDRTDVVCPDTGAGAVRDAKGAIVGTLNFQCK